MGEDTVEVAGLGEAVFLACTSVHLAMDVMDIGISEISINYVQYATLGRFDAVYLLLSQTNRIDFKSQMASLDSQIQPGMGEAGGVITVAKNNQPARLALLALFKLRNHERLKIVGAGGAINQAVSVALMLTKGKLAKRPVGIEFVGLSDVADKDQPTKKTTGIEIYLKRDLTTSYSSQHLRAITLIQSGKIV